jgi:ABC-type nitrate/sulfonate/bicarbonate transport system substrate-binding protein
VRIWQGCRALVVALALVAPALVGCGSGNGGGGGGGGGGNPDQPPAQPVKIRMGWGIPAEEIKYVMMANPSLAPNMGKWYTVEWNQFAGTALGVQGLAAGTLDGATVGSLSVANGLDRGADIVITGEFIEERQPYFSTTWMARKDSGITTADQVRGKTVATSAVGGSTDYIQDFYFEKAGLKANRDYKKVELPFAQQQEALLSGRIDVGLFPQPFYGKIIATNQVRPLFRLVDVQEPFVQLLQGFRRDFIKDNPMVVKKFVEDWTRVAQYVANPANRQKVIAASAKATKLPQPVLEKYLLTKQDFYRPANGAVNITALQKNWDFFRKAGGIRQPLQVRDHVMPEYLPPGSK